jgi:hypothetical protein
MIEDFEDWWLKCMMRVKRWHHIEPSGISETLLKDCFAEELRPHEVAKYAAERVQEPRRPGRLTAW